MNDHQVSILQRGDEFVDAVDHLLARLVEELLAREPDLRQHRLHVVRVVLARGQATAQVRVVAEYQRHATTSGGRGGRGRRGGGRGYDG